MDKTLAIVFSVILIMMIIFTQIYIIGNKGYFNTITGINIMYCIVFGVIPILLLSMDFSNYASTTYIRETLYSYGATFGYASLLAIIGYLSILSGYFIGRYRRKMYIIDGLNIRRLYIFANITFIIGLLSLLLTVRQLGGLLGAIKYADMLRSYGKELVSLESSYLRILIPLIVASCSVFYLIKEYTNSRYSTLMFYITFLLSLYYFIFNAGRLPLFIFIASFIMYRAIKNKNRINIIKLIIIILIGILILNYADKFFAYISYGVIRNDSSNLLEKVKQLIVEFAFPYCNLSKVHGFTYNGEKFRWFIDLFTWIINIVPVAILSKFGLWKVANSHNINTENFNSLLEGGIPTDIVSLGYYQFSIIGVIVLCIIFGYIAKRLDYFISNNNITCMRFIKIRIIFFISFIVMYADIDSIIRGKLDITTVIIIIWFSTKKVQNGGNFE